LLAYSLGSKSQPILQIKESINVDGEEEKIKENLKIFIFKEENKDMIIEMHYVGHFIV
jgi:hypothetical protein